MIDFIDPLSGGVYKSNHSLTVALCKVPPSYYSFALTDAHVVNNKVDSKTAMIIFFMPHIILPDFFTLPNRNSYWPLGLFTLYHFEEQPHYLETFRRVGKVSVHISVAYD